MPHHTFIVRQMFHIPADGPCDPARTWYAVVGTAETLGWAKRVAAKAVSALWATVGEDGDPYPYECTEILAHNGRYWDVVRERAPVAPLYDADIPF